MEALSCSLPPTSGRRATVAERKKSRRKFPKKRVVEPAEPGPLRRKTYRVLNPGARPPGFPLPYIRPEQEEQDDVSGE